MISTFLKTLEKDNKKALIFKIPIKNRRHVFMSINTKNSFNDERYIVIVNTKEFLDLWKNEPNSHVRELSHGNKEVWEQDKKFSLADEGFSFGIEDPVPLSIIDFNFKTQKVPIFQKYFFFLKKQTGVQDKEIPYLSLTHITRTIWLLANDATYFPLVCRNYNEAKNLVKYAGYKSNDYISVEELLKPYNKALEDE